MPNLSLVLTLSATMAGKQKAPRQKSSPGWPNFSALWYSEKQGQHQPRTPKKERELVGTTTSILVSLNTA